MADHKTCSVCGVADLSVLTEFDFDKRESVDRHVDKFQCITVGRIERDALRARLQELEQERVQLKARIEEMANDAINKVVEMTDDQVRALNRLEGRDPADVAALTKIHMQLAIERHRAESAERTVAELRSALAESLTSGVLFGCHDEPLDDYGKRLVRVIHQRLKAPP